MLAIEPPGTGCLRANKHNLHLLRRAFDDFHLKLRPGIMYPKASVG